MSSKIATINLNGRYFHWEGLKTHREGPKMHREGPTRAPLDSPDLDLQCHQISEGSAK